MVNATGKNHFEGCYDFFEWSAPFYETPQEVIRALREMSLKGKVLKSINIIGKCEHVGNASVQTLYDKITNAGIKLEGNWLEEYPHIDSVLVPWTVDACEPIQFVFEDETTLEILPLERGGARIAENSIPAGMCDGLNQSNFDSNTFFREAIGKSIREIAACKDTNTKQYFSYNTVDNEKTYEEIRTSNTLNILFEYPFKIELIWTRNGWYCIQMCENGNQIPFSRCKEAHKETKQICIVNGSGHGGYFSISSICSNEEQQNRLVDFDRYSFSVDIDDLYPYLSVFLEKHFDPELQTQVNDYAKDYHAFDWYGYNIYPFCSVRKMIQDINEAATLLKEDFDNPKIADLKERLPYRNNTGKRNDELTENDINELRKSCVPLALDFYARFVKQLEKIMLLPERDTVEFIGP